MIPNPNTPDRQITDTTRRIAEALLSLNEAASGVLEALELFQQVAAKLEQVTNDVKRMPHSESPLLLSQFVARDADSALQMLRKGLEILPPPNLLLKTETGVFSVPDDQFEKLIGPLNEKDVLREGDIAFLQHHPAGRLFRKVCGAGLIGKQLRDTPLHIVYRQP